MKYIVNMLLIMTSSVFLACSSNTITKAQIDNVCTQTTAIEKGVRLTNLMCSGNYDKALVLLDTLLEIDPYAPNYYFCQGWCYDMLGDSLKAKKSYLQAKELYNNLQDALSRRNFA
jgi:tetratricopeptide (TPR) repeat protein